jgi:hypothetical protein
MGKWIVQFKNLGTVCPNNLAYCGKNVKYNLSHYGDFNFKQLKLSTVCC